MLPVSGKITDQLLDHLALENRLLTASAGS